MFFNLITAEFLFAVGMGTAIVAMWPDINWDYLTYGAVGGMAITPIVLYPFSKVLYLTVDTFMRPVRPEECDPYTEACDCHDADLNIPPRGGLIDFLQEGLPRVSDPLPLCRHLAVLLELDGKPELAEKYRRRIDDASHETHE